MEEKPDATQIRALLALEPQLAQLAESLRRDFGARLVGLQAGGRDIGWTKYRESVAHAEIWQRPWNLREGRQQLAEISKKAFEARSTTFDSAARRKPSLVRRRASLS